MHISRCTSVLAVVAGSVAVLPRPAAADFTCTIQAWVWEGDLGSDFMTAGNWFNCGLINGPTPLMPVYFGPTEWFINGDSQGITYPRGPAVLTQNFNSPSVRLLSNSNTSLTVAGAVYTSNGTIGERSANFDHTGLATLTLDNAVWDGNLTIGNNGGNGCLVFRGGSLVTGSIGFGSGTICFANETDVTPGLSSSNDARYSTVTWENRSGSVLRLEGGDYFYNSLQSDDNDLIDNRGGAEIRKEGDGTAYIYWPYDGAGDVTVEEGELRFSQSRILADQFLAAVSSGATLTFGGTTIDSSALIVDLAPDATLKLNDVVLGGEGAAVELSNTSSGTIYLGGLSGTRALAIDGGNTVSVETNSTLDTEIINRGATLIETGYFDGRYGTGIWRNSAGSILTMTGSYPFYNSLSSDTDDLVINEAGATIRKTDTGTTYIRWPYDGSGDLIVEQGILRFNGSRIYSQTISAEVANGAELQYSGIAIESDRIDVDLADGATISLLDVSLENPGGVVKLVNSGSGLVHMGTITGPSMLKISGSHRADVATNSTLNATIENEGDITFEDGYFDGRYGVGTWRNLPGSTLTLTTSYPFYNSLSSDKDDRVVNELGATIRKTGSGTTYIRWPYDGDGAIEIVQGTLALRYIPVYADRIEVTLGEDAHLDLTDLDLIGDGTSVVLHATGSGSIHLNDLNGDADLVLTGTSPVTATSGSTLDTRIINRGEIEFSTGYFDGRYGVGTWLNEAGSILRMGGSYPFYNSLSNEADDLLVNEEGATIIKLPDTATTYIHWPFKNRGTIEIQTGTLVIRNADFDTSLQTAPTSRIIGVGRLQFPVAPAFYNRGTISPSPVDLDATPDGLVIDTPFIQNADTAVFSTQVGSLAGRLTCTGVYDVGGSIDIQRFGDFEPDGSEEFVVIDAEFVSGVFGDYFTNAVPLTGMDTALDVRTGDLEFDLTYTSTQVIVSNISVVVPPCNPADLAEPGGLLDLRDVTAFVQAFVAQDPAADLAEPVGLFDLSDLIAFTSAFLAGCP